MTFARSSNPFGTNDKLLNANAFAAVNRSFRSVSE